MAGEDATDDTASGWWQRLGRFWRPARASASDPAPRADDPRLQPLPVYGSAPPLNGFEALAAWADDEAAAREHLTAALQSWRAGAASTVPAGSPPDPGHPSSADGPGEATACTFGQWLSSLRPEGQFDLLDDLKMWHAHWHRLHRQLLEEVAHGQTGAAEDALEGRPSPWLNAARRVRGLVEQLWLQRPAKALELRTPGRSRWLAAQLLREAEGGERLTVSVRHELATGALVLVRDANQPQAPSRPYRVELCRPGQRGLLDQGVYIVYLTT